MLAWIVIPPPIGDVELFIVALCVEVVADTEVSRRPPETLDADPETTPSTRDLDPEPLPKLDTLPVTDIALVDDAEPEMLEIDGEV